MLHSSPVAPIRGVFLSYSPCRLGRSSPWRRVHPRTIQSGGLCCASFRPGCSNPGRLFVVFSPLPRTLQSVAPGSPPDDSVQGLAPCFIPPRLLQSGGYFCHILSAASDAPVRGTGFTPGRSSPGASAVLHSAPVAPNRGVFLSYSLRCLGRSSPWHRVHPRTIQSGGLRRASILPGCSNPGGLFVVLSLPPRTLQSVAPGSPPDDPVRGNKKGGVCCAVCVVSWDTWFVFSGVAVCCGVRGVRCAVLRVRCPGPPGPCSPVRTPGLWCCVGGVLGRLAAVACSVCCVLCAVSWATWLLFTGVRARCVAWCVGCGCGRVLACAIPLLRRCGPFVFVYTWLDTAGNAAANSPLASRPPRRPASYGVLLILPVLDSLVLATPKSKRVLMHARRCMLFIRWFVDSLHFATPKSRRVCLMHS